VKNPLRKRTALDLSPPAKVAGYASLIVWAIIVLFPIYWLVITSLKLPIQVAAGPFYIPGIDFTPTFDNWHYILVDRFSDTVRPFANTIIVALCSSTLALILGSSGAYALVRFHYRPRIGVIAIWIVVILGTFVAVALGAPWPLAVVAAIAVLLILLQTVGKRFKRTLANSDVSFWLISQRMMPPVAVVIPIYVLFQTIGMLDTLPALIVTYTAANLAIVVWLMRDYFLSIPLDLEESASVDGASSFRTFRSIILPISRPGLVATWILVLVFSWNEYLLALFLSSANAQTMPVMVAAQNSTRGPEWWYMSVLILLMIIPVIILAVVLERFIASGALRGAVKG